MVLRDIDSCLSTTGGGSPTTDMVRIMICNHLHYVNCVKYFSDRKLHSVVALFPAFRHVESLTFLYF